MLIIAVQYGSVMTILQLAPFVLQKDLGFSAADYGWIILLVGFGSFISSSLNKYTSQKFDLDKIILFGISLSMFMIFSMNILSFFWFNVWVIMVPIFIFRIGGGFIYSNCITQGLAEMPEHVGSISALYGVVITLGASCISAIVAHVPDYKQWSLSFCLLVEVLTIFALFVSIKFVKINKK
jgi:predicted MFS family arabinose efflux permease